MSDPTSRSNERAPRRRRNKLPLPRVQLFLAASFVTLCAFGLVLQHVIFVNRMSALAASLPNDGAVFLDEFPSVLRGGVLLALAVTLPLVFALGVIATGRIVGPLVRFQAQFVRFGRGERWEPFRVRGKDAFGELYETVNHAFEARGEAAEATSRAGAHDRAA